MPANHNVPHTAEAKAKMSAARLGVPTSKVRPTMIVDGEQLYRCCTCKEFKPSNEFYPRRNKTGFSSQCKPCHSEMAIRTRDPDNAREHGRVSSMNQRARMAGVRGKITRAEYRIIKELFAACAKCGGTVEMELDHVIPLASGGVNRPENIQGLYSGCNDQKHCRSNDYRTSEQIAILVAFE